MSVPQLPAAMLSSSVRIHQRILVRGHIRLRLQYNNLAADCSNAQLVASGTIFACQSFHSVLAVVVFAAVEVEVELIVVMHSCPCFLHFVCNQIVDYKWDLHL